MKQLKSTNYSSQCRFTVICTVLSERTKYLWKKKWMAGFGLLLIFNMVYNNNAIAQAPNFAWARSMGSPLSNSSFSSFEDLGTQIALDAAGNVYTTGRFNGTVDFDPGPGVTNLVASTTSGVYSVFVTKFDAGGGFIWARSFDVVRSHDPSLAVDSAGNVYLTGAFLGDCDFDPGVNNYFFNSGSLIYTFIVKLNTSGNFIWAKQIGGTTSASNTLSATGNGITVDNTGNVYVAGAFHTGVVDFDPGPDSFKLSPSPSGFNAFILKLNKDGDFIWVRHLGSGTTNATASSIALDPSGNILTLGTFMGKADFDPGRDTFTLDADKGGIFVSKLDATGNFIWAKNMVPGLFKSADALTTDKVGNVYITGYFYSFPGPVDFDPGPDTYNLESTGGSVFISKLDYNGNFGWVKNLGANGVQMASGRSIKVDSEGNVYTAGFSRTGDFDPGPNTFILDMIVAGGFVSKLDSLGNFVWAGKLDGDANALDKAHGLALNNQGYIYVTGAFFGTADFDPGTGNYDLVSLGGSDIFIVKLGQCYGPTTQELTICANQLPYTWNGITVTAAGTAVATFTTTSSMGCDSTVTLNLAANPTINTTQSLSVCSNQLPYTWNGINVTTGGPAAATFTIKNVSGCDSTTTLNLTVRQTSTFTQSATICNNQLPYIWNNISVTSGGTTAATYTTINYAGCDSTVILNLTVNNTVATTEDIAICSNQLPYTWNGINISSGGPAAATFTTKNVSGCDSTVTLNLTLNDSTFHTLTATACGSYTLNNHTYTISGTYTQVFENATGCDSILTLYLTLNTEANTEVDQNGSTLTAQATGLSYQWIDCNNNNTPVPGATAQSFTPETSGRYAVIVKEDNCIDTSFCFTVTTTGIHQLRSGNKINLFPNPTDGFLTLHVEEKVQNASISIVNMIGQVLTKIAHQDGLEFRLNIAGYAPGVYFIELEEKGKVVRMKAVKR